MVHYATVSQAYKHKTEPLIHGIPVAFVGANMTLRGTLHPHTFEMFIRG